MPRRRYAHAVALAISVALLALIPACGRTDHAGAQPNPSNADPAPTRIVATIPPIAWAVRGVAPEHAEVDLLIQPGVSPHGFELTPAQVLTIARADVIVMAGAALEPAVEAVLRAHPSDARRVIRFHDALTPADTIASTPHDHDHPGHDHDHDHGPIDPHFWLDPLLMDRFIARLAEAFDTAARAAPLSQACRDIHAEYETAIAAFPRRTLVVQHAAYAYLCRRYNLTVGATLRPIDTVEPTPRDIAAARALIEREGVRAIYIEPQVSRAAADRLAEKTGAKVLTLDPLGDADWPATMRANLDALKQGLADH